NINEKDLLKFCAYAESFSSHPVAKAIVSEYFTQTGEVINKSTISNVNEIAGNGVLITLDNDIILAGNDKLMMKHNILFKKSNMVGTVVYVAKNGEYLGYIIVSDEIKKDSSYTIETLKSIGIEQTIMLTGDKKQVGEHVANLLKIDKVYTELLPAQKAEITENILKTKEKKDTVIFVGDGINDAPVLKMVDVGIAMGAIGSDAAIEAADVVLMDDKPSKIINAIKLSKKTLLIVKQNIIFALGVKLIFLILSAFGFANMWEAVFADVGVSIIAILNAMRMLKVKKDK
ncbi:MAG: HAD-IC family P-type ATPase, partial [Oscillospiraceae bacterium]